MTKTNGRTARVCLIASGGGHLKQLHLLREAYSKYTNFLVTTRGFEDTQLLPGISVRYTVDDINEGRWRNPFRLCKVIVQFGWIFWKEKPQVLVSTGSGIAVPGFVLGRALRAKTIFIEAGARALSLSQAGRVCYLFADLFLVQYRAQQQRYPRAIYRGAIYDNLGE